MTTQTAAPCDITSIPYECPNCRTKVGDLVQVNGWVRLDAGGWLIGDGMKHCHRCGRMIHVKAPKESWSELVARYLERLAAAGRVPVGRTA